MSASKFLVTSNGGLSVFAVKCGHLDTNTGFIENANCGEAIVIDPSFGSFAESKKILSPQTKIIAALCTHGHWDHIGDGHIFQELGAKVYSHELDKPLIEHPEVMAAFASIEEELVPCKVNGEITDGSVLNISNWFEAACRWVPGHTMGGVTFYMKTLGCVFTGDTLFRGCIGRSDFHGGNEDLLIEGIKNKILTLPEETIVIPGHGAHTTIAREKAENEFFS
ncbi:MAG: MBL fold metallo-hydrolase [Puniceicoccales bacterium]|nr:MBL fold metallo-hydrolase [Puniceicoccales bacterium]